MKRLQVVMVVAGLVIVAGVAVSKSHDEDAQEAAATKPIRISPNAKAIALQFGLKDERTTDWSGSITLSAGTIVALRTYGGLYEAAGTEWKLPEAKPKQTKKKAQSDAAQDTTNQNAANAKQKKKQLRKAAKAAEATRLRVVATIDAPPDANIRIMTRQGEFAFALAELRSGKRREFLDGNAAAETAVATTQLTTADTDDDFPAAATGRDGTNWLVYVAYRHGSNIQLPDSGIPDDWSSLVTRGHGDQIKLLRFDGTTWSDAGNVTDPAQDVWRPTVAVDGSGRVHVVWSQNFGGTWELATRAFDPGARKWSNVERLRGCGEGINPVAVADSAGVVWVAYQSWQRDNYNIRLTRQANQSSGWIDPIALTSGAGNDWNPTIAADSKGRVHVAHDTYDAGNYDVLLHTVTAGDATVRHTAVATTPKFEARATVAVDKDDRVWVAFEEAGVNWAKDFGSRWTGPSGVPFYLERHISVRVVQDGRVEQPIGRVDGAGVDTLYPGGSNLRHSMPRLAVDSDGRVWLLYRHHPRANGAGEVWSSFATYHRGDSWAPELVVPNSENFIDNRPALLRQGAGVGVVYATDWRTNNTASGRDNDLNTCVLFAESAPQSPQLGAMPASPADPPAIHPDESADVRRIRDFRVSLAGHTYQLLRGEFHRHTEISAHRDQDGPFEEIWRYGLDVARMDWLGQGDHDNGNREYPWWLSQKQDDIYHHASIFMPMFTYERSVVYPSGHRNVMFARRGIRPLPRLRGDLMGTPEAGSPDVKRLFAYLRHFGGICSSHTSATNMGTDWRDHDNEVEPVVEVFQGHRQNYEHKDAPQSAKDAADSIGGYQPAGYIWNALQRGYRLGFQVSSDHISTHLSYAVVLAENSTREEIVEAFKRRHTYGAQDNILLVVRSGEHLMGDEFATTERPTFEISAVGTAPIARVVIVRGIGQAVPTYVYESKPDRANISLRWTDEQPSRDDTAYYYVRIEQADGKLAWASPMWIRFRPND